MINMIKKMVKLIKNYQKKAKFDQKLNIIELF